MIRHGVASPDRAFQGAASEDEARISPFRDLVHRLRTEAGLTQAELAGRDPWSPGELDYEYTFD